MTCRIKLALIAQFVVEECRKVHVGRHIHVGDGVSLKDCRSLSGNRNNFSRWNSYVGFVSVKQIQLLNVLSFVKCNVLLC